MLVSLCMIAYNESNALSGLFRDIALQDYPHDKMEWVFVDSMSTDDTKELGCTPDDIEAAIFDSIKLSKDSFEGKAKLLEMKGE